ncbi:hypothetical protein Pfo_023588 [Paulownia fortunei]|nr:hypothetical protein Pfo_023588 [Paulownia fortunei]
MGKRSPLLGINGSISMKQTASKMFSHAQIYSFTYILLRSLQSDSLMNFYTSRLTGSKEAAMLQQVNWLEITWKFDLPASSIISLPRSYKVYYMLKFNDDAFGWSRACGNQIQGEIT